MCDDELANAFLCDVMEAPLDATDTLLRALPNSVFPVLSRMLAEFSERDYIDDQHAYINDGRTLEERQEYYRIKQPHYRQVGERLAELLRRE